jgi:hypothetical protein
MVLVAAANKNKTLGALVAECRCADTVIIMAVNAAMFTFKLRLNGPQRIPAPHLFV